MPKVNATAGLIRQLNCAVEVHVVNERFRRSIDVTEVVFVCVDQIETRRLIWDTLSRRTLFLADGRMSADVVQVLVATDAASRKHYPTSLFSTAETFNGSCPAKRRIFTSNIAARLMIQQFVRCLRQLPVDGDLALSLLSSELVVTDMAAFTARV